MESAPLPARFPAIVRALSADLVEREEAISIALLTAIAGENLLFLGPPGTGKSLVARRVAESLGGARFFQVLLTRFSTPEELFGPVSLAALRDRDAYERKVDGYLPTAQIAFIDEVFKASSAILNTLLTVLNERVYQNGAARLELPLIGLFAASNEVPAEEGADALADRFTARALVEPVRGEDAFLRLVCEEQAPAAAPLGPTPAEMAALRRRAAGLPVGPGARVALAWLRARFEPQPGDELAPRRAISDRRWRRAVGLLRVAAALDGRDMVELADCTILRFCLWNHPDDAGRTAAMVRESLEEPAAHCPGALTRWRVAWSAALARLRDLPGVAEALPGGYGLRAGERRWELDDAEFEALRRLDPDAVARQGLLYEPGKDALRAVRRAPDGALATRWGQSWADVARLLRYGHGRDALELEEAEVVVVRRAKKGARFGFGGQDPARLRAELVEATEALAALEADVERARRVGHRALFLTPADERALALGPARAALLALEGRDRLESLLAAIAVGGRWASTEIDVG